MTWSNLLFILSGLGLFLFGMTFLEIALRETAGRKLKTYLRRFTSTTPRALLTGMAGTAALQSSSIVSLMTLSFVGAGLMTLTGAIGVLFGANLGTTATAWLLVLFGFKVNIEAFALPIVGISALILIFLKNPKAKAVARIFIGFGLLFLGLGYMKEGTELFAQSIHLEKYLGRSMPVYLGLGILLTLLVQSSSAATAILLSLLNAGLIDFPSGAVMAIGSNIGTTVKVFLGSIGGSPDKKRVALAHFLFNFITALAALLLLKHLVHLISDVFALRGNGTLELALFHTLFNLLGVALLSPFIRPFVKGLRRFFKTTEEPLVLYLGRVDPSFPVAGLAALKQETLNLFQRTCGLIMKVFGVSAENAVALSKAPEGNERHRKKQPVSTVLEMYLNIKTLEAKILSFTTELTSKTPEAKEILEIDRILRAVRELVFAAKSIKDIQSNIEELASSEQAYCRDIHGKFQHRWGQYFENFSRMLSGDIRASTEILALHREISEENRSSLENISDAIRTRRMDDAMASTILNADRAVFLASDAVLEAAKLLLLLREEGNHQAPSSA